MKQFLELILLYVSLLSVFSCSVGAGGGSSSASTFPEAIVTPSPSLGGGGSPIPDSRAPATPNFPPASTMSSVKVLQIDTEKFQCGEAFHSQFKDNKVGINVKFGAARTFTAVVNFYDSSCANLQLPGNKIATYTVSGDYAVTTVSGTLFTTITSSALTINAGDFPGSAKNMVDWINGCENITGTFSSSQNTTLSFATGPDCKNTPGQRFPFPIVGSTFESTENDLKKFVGLN